MGISKRPDYLIDDAALAEWRWPNFTPAEFACKGTGRLLIAGAHVSLGAIGKETKEHVLDVGLRVSQPRAGNLPLPPPAHRLVAAGVGVGAAHACALVCACAVCAGTGRMCGERGEGGVHRR